MLRYSLGSLFLVVLYVSVACAALVNATGIWPQVAITLTLAILVLFSLRAVFGNERWRVFSIGFSALGWLYILLVFSDVTSIRPYLLTETATNKLYQMMHADQTGQYRFVVQTTATPNGLGTVQRVVYATPSPPPQPAPGQPTPLAVYPSPAYTATALPAGIRVANAMYVDPQSFANIGHSLWAVIVAFIGGVTAQVFYANRRKHADIAEGRD